MSDIPSVLSGEGDGSTHEWEYESSTRHHNIRRYCPLCGTEQVYVRSGCRRQHWRTTHGPLFAGKEKACES